VREPLWLLVLVLVPGLLLRWRARRCPCAIGRFLAYGFLSDHSRPPTQPQFLGARPKSPVCFLNDRTS
jgi:hypothetical protein